MPPDMAQEGRSRVWRKCRVYFRRFRITVLLLMLALLGAAMYLELHGLPQFVQRPVLEKLRAQGVDLDFTRLRLRLYRGLVADNVSFGQAHDPLGPRLTARQVEMHLDVEAMKHFQWQINELDLRGGRLAWPVGETNAAGRVLAVEEIEARLRLLPGDEWALDNFSAQFAGARFFLSGSVTNASALRDWKLGQAKPAESAGQWPKHLRKLADTLERISFTTPPELRLIVEGDARDWQSFIARLTLNARDADTPWGQATNLLLRARLFPGAGGELTHIELNLRSRAARTPWAEVAGLDLEVHIDSVAGQTNLMGGDVTVKAAHAVTQWASATNAHLTGHWVHSLTNPIPVSAQGELRAASASSQWADGERIRLAFGFMTATNPPPTDAAWAWWEALRPYEMDWEVELGKVATEKITARNILCAGAWRAPGLSVTNLKAQLFDGSVKAQTHLDVATREAQFTLASDFDVQKLSPLLPPQASEWLGKFSWQDSPRVQGSGVVTLPAWTNRPPDWQQTLMPTLRLAGEFAVTNGAYLGVTTDWARSHISFTNQVWRMPDLEASRPDGQLSLTHISDDKSQDFYFGIRSTVDLRAVRPLLNPEAQRGFDLLRTTQAPVVEGELWGRWHDFERMGARAHVALTNFAFREQTADSFVTDMRYTNRVLILTKPWVWRGTQVVTAAGVALDFDTMRLHFTNGYSTAEPMAVGRAIGPQTAHHIEPFIFKVPPTVHAEGYVAIKDEDPTDMHFAVDGGPFEWWKFKLPHIKGNAHWRGDTLQLTNVQTDFYWGTAAGYADFYFPKDRPGTDYSFSMSVADANLQMLMADLNTHSNRLQGRFSGNLVITKASTTDMNTWNGSGRVRLRDGLIWEIPIFGILSKPLDALMPGLGNTTVSEGSARFIITNGVIGSEDLEMRAAAMRLHYDGTVDFDGRVNARVEAQPLRDTWVVGRLLSIALWPVTKALEYKVSGTLGDPKMEPLYMPAKVLLAPLHPFQTLEDLFTPNSNKTNAAPIFKEP